MSCAAIAVPVSITAAYVVPLPCSAFDPAFCVCPRIDTGGTNGPDASDPFNWNSIQYVPAGSVVPILAVIAITGLVLPSGAVSVAR
jgi:hypothetical protein